MIVLTTLLTSTPDPQRGTKWECDPDLAEMLAASCARHGHRLVILHDEKPSSWPQRHYYSPWRHVEWVAVQRNHVNPYVDRWQHYSDYFRKGWSSSFAWFVDATDVELLRTPDRMQTNRLFVGSEDGTLATGPGAEWLAANHALARGLAEALPNATLYNAGIVGGAIPELRRFARSVRGLLDEATTELTDMAAFNVAAHAWPDRVVTGNPVHTPFRAEQRDHPTAWWRHK